jgi:ribosomal protein S27E
MQVIRRSAASGDERPGPRWLPKVSFGRTTYFVDERLHEFRHVDNPYKRVSFGSPRGVWMLRRFYVDVCRSCLQDVAIMRDTASERVPCSVCGSLVRTQRV